MAVRYISMAIKSGFPSVAPIYNVKTKRFRRSTPHPPPTTTTTKNWIYTLLTSLLLLVVVMAVVVVAVVKGKRKCVVVKGGTWYPNLEGTLEGYKASNIRSSMHHLNNSCLLEGKETSMSEEDDEEDHYPPIKRKKSGMTLDNTFLSSQTTFLPLSSASSSTSSSSPHPNNNNPNNNYPNNNNPNNNNPHNNYPQPTPLMLAVTSNSDTSLLKELIDRGEAVNTKDHNGNTALHMACQRSKPDKAAMLLDEAGISVNEENNKGRTPLHEAVAAASDECVQILLDNKKTKVNLRDHNGVTPLIQAVKLALDDIFNVFVHTSGIDVDAKDCKGRTALHWCAMLNNEEAAKVLLRKNAKRDIPDCHQETPLYLAVKEVNINMVKLLKTHCANTNLKSDLGYLALDEAQKRRMVDICEVLEKPDQSLKSMANASDDNSMLPSYIFKQVNPKGGKPKDTKEVISPHKQTKKNVKVEGGVKGSKSVLEGVRGIDGRIRTPQVKTDVNNNNNFCNNNNHSRNNNINGNNNSTINSERMQQVSQLRRNKSNNNNSISQHQKLKKPISRISSVNFPPAPTTTSPPLPTTTTSPALHSSYATNERPLSGDLGYDLISGFMKEQCQFDKNDFSFNNKNNNLYLNYINNSLLPINNNDQQFFPCTITQQIVPRNEDNYNNNNQKVSRNSLNNNQTNITPNNKTISLYELSPPDSSGIDSSGCISPQSNLTISPTPSSNFSPNNQQQRQQLLLLKQQKQHSQYFKNKQITKTNNNMLKQQNVFYAPNDVQQTLHDSANNNNNNYATMQQHFPDNNTLTGSGALASFHNNYKNNKEHDNNNTYNNAYLNTYVYNNTYNNNNTFTQQYDPSYNACLTPSPEYTEPTLEKLNNNYLNNNHNNYLINNKNQLPNKKY